MAENLTWIDMGDVGFQSPGVALSALTTGGNHFPLRVITHDAAGKEEMRMEAQKVEKKKLGAPKRRSRVDREDGSTPNDETRIRPGTDIHSRSVPDAVRRAVWSRDGGQCAFVSETGRRCGEQTFLELHHIHPYALNGPTSVGNISLRCRGHNAYESEMVFGPRVAAERSDRMEPGRP